MKQIAAMATLFVISTASAAQAGGLIQSLPPDGSWVKYHVDVKEPGRDQKIEAVTMTLRSVGAVVENDEKHRWIELHLEFERKNVKQSRLLKMLISEKDLKAGANSTPTVVRGWKKESRNDELKELTAEEKSATGMQAMFFGGKRKNVKILKAEKIIDYQKGQIKVASGTQGVLEIKPPGDANAKVGLEATQSVWPHKAVPFGLAEMYVTMKITVGDNPPMTSKMKFTLLDHGTGAKSALPDQK